MSKVRLSVIIPAKNEKTNIVPVLNALKDWVDEIFVVDSQSTDGMPDVVAELAKDADALWTDARIDRVIDKLAQHRIALEINSRYRIPSVKVLKKAKARGLKFAFGTNNVDANIGRLEWALGAAAVFAFASAILLSSAPAMKKTGKRVALISWGVLALVVFAGGSIASEVESMWEGRGENLENKRLEQSMIRV